MADQGMEQIPKGLLDRGETITLKDGRPLLVPRWSAVKSVQVAQMLAKAFEGVPEDELRAAVEAKSILAFLTLGMRVAEQGVFAIAEVCLSPEDRGRVNPKEMDWGDFVNFCGVVAKVNLKEDDLKNLKGLVPWLQKRGAGPLTTPSSRSSA